MKFPRCVDVVCKLLWSLLLCSIFYYSSLAETPVPPEETKTYSTYFILFHGVSGQYLLNCSAPQGNVSYEITHAKWQPPSGVALVSQANRTAGVGGAEAPSETSAWVELTDEQVLHFHQPDTSVQGVYTCQGMQDSRVIYTTAVWVHVMDKYVFNLGQRLLFGFLAAGVFILCIVVLRFVCRMLPEKNVGYTVANQEDIMLQNSTRFDEK